MVLFLWLNFPHSIYILFRICTAVRNSSLLAHASLDYNVFGMSDPWLVESWGIGSERWHFSLVQSINLCCQSILLTRSSALSLSAADVTIPVVCQSKPKSNTSLLHVSILRRGCIRASGSCSLGSVGFGCVSQ